MIYSPEKLIPCFMHHVERDDPDVRTSSARLYAFLTHVFFRESQSTSSASKFISGQQQIAKRKIHCSCLKKVGILSERGDARKLMVIHMTCEGGWVYKRSAISA